MFACQNFIRDTTQRIDIIPHIGLLAGEHFQAGVGRRQRAQGAGIEHRDIACFAALPIDVGHGARDSEIENLRHAGLGDKNITGLEIGVHDVFFVRMDQRRT